MLIKALQETMDLGTGKTSDHTVRGLQLNINKPTQVEDATVIMPVTIQHCGSPLAATGCVAVACASVGQKLTDESSAASADRSAMACARSRPEAGWQGLYGGR